MTYTRNILLGFIGGFATVTALWLSFDSGSALMLAMDIAEYASRARELLAALAMGGSIAFAVCAALVRNGLVSW